MLVIKLFVNHTGCAGEVECRIKHICVFIHKEVRGTNKIKIKNGLQYTNKKVSLPGDAVIYTPGDLVMN